MIRLVELLSFFVGLFLLYRSYTLVRKKEEDVKSFLLWGLIGIVLIILSVNISLIDYFLSFFNMTSTANLVFTTGILLCIILIFEMFKEMKKMESKISKINDELSIIDYQQRERKGK